MFGTDNLKVYLATGATDMRKAINGLSVLVDDLDLDPFSGHLFVFCNRRRTMLKILYWQVNGFCLWRKRRERDRFHCRPRPYPQEIGAQAAAGQSSPGECGA